MGLAARGARRPLRHVCCRAALLALAAAAAAIAQDEGAGGGGAPLPSAAALAEGEKTPAAAPAGAPAGKEGDSAADVRAGAAPDAAAGAAAEAGSASEVSKAPAEPTVAFATTADRGYVARAAVAVMRAASLHPGTVAYVAGDTSLWSPAEKALLRKHGVRHLHISRARPALKELANRPGAYGKWPVEAFMTMLLPELLGDMGFTHAVVIDGDILTMDGALLGEVSKVEGIGYVPIMPEVCLTQRYPRAIASLERLAKEFGTGGYTLRKGVNSGVVVYNCAKLKELRWFEWVVKLFESSPSEWPSDQDLLNVAWSRNDVPLTHLDARFNMRLVVPLGQGCFYDVRDMAERWASGAHTNVTEYASFIHYVWGPKPWAPGAHGDVEPGKPYTPESAYTRWSYVGGVSESVNLWREYVVREFGEEAVRLFGPYVHVRLPVKPSYVHPSQMKLGRCEQLPFGEHRRAPDQRCCLAACPKGTPEARR